LCSLSSGMERFIPNLSGSGHGIENGQELSHAGDDGDLFEFSCGNESIIKALDHLVPTDRGPCCHGETTADLGAPCEDGSFSSHLPRIAIKGCDAWERADFTTGQLPQLRNLCNKHGDRGRAHARDCDQQMGKIRMVNLDARGNLAFDFLATNTSPIPDSPLVFPTFDFEELGTQVEGHPHPRLALRHPRETCARLERGAGIQPLPHAMDSRLRGSDEGLQWPGNNRWTTACGGRTSEGNRRPFPRILHTLPLVREYRCAFPSAFRSLALSRK